MPYTNAIYKILFFIISGFSILASAELPPLISYQKAVRCEFANNDVVLHLIQKQDRSEPGVVFTSFSAEIDLLQGSKPVLIATDLMKDAETVLGVRQPEDLEAPAYSIFTFESDNGSSSIKINRELKSGIITAGALYNQSLKNCVFLIAL